MKNIQPFINLGWHTVPLKGKLKRLDNGKKTIPYFPENFKEYYTDNFNNDATALGGVMTGPASGIIAIDCDNEATYKIFCSLDPEYDFHFVSKGKGYAAGTIIYKYTEELEESFGIKNNNLELDFYSTKGFVYLPTEENKTKETLTTIPNLKEPPNEIIALLRSLKPVKLRVAETEVRNKNWKLNLAPQLQQFLTNKTVTKALFKTLTPRDFRTTDEYLENSFCHPKNIADGRGSEYLSKVSAILGADESVDEDLYTKVILMINDFFDEPMERKRLSSTIIEPMIEERSKINGEVIWRYDKHWQENSTIIISKLNSSLHVFFDMHREAYYAVDIANEHIHSFDKDSNLYSFLEAIAVDLPSKKELKSSMPLVKVISTPKHPFGFYGDNKDIFNVFVPTVPLMIFKDPQSYAKNYTYPKTVLQFLDHLVPDDYMRSYLLKFLRRKLDKFEYSPVVLYMLGASGSGKDLFVQLLSAIIGNQAIAKPTAKEFVEKHNGWMLDKYFAHLDEYGDQLTKFHEQEEAKGKIKAWSGKPEVSIRSMRSDGFSYEHNITFIMTANKNPLTFDADDRRIALFDTPEKLRFLPAVEEQGLEVFVAKLFDEINDFAYWLSTERENATLDEYMSPPETKDKKLLIASRLSAGARIAFYLSNGLFEEFEQMAADYGIESIFGKVQENKIYEDDLFNLYMELTEDQGTKRGLTAAMKQFEKLPTTRDGSKAYWYKIPGLRAMGNMTFSPIEGDV